MNFKCYDVVEIQGKRYVVTEVISYQEFIIEKTVNYTLNDEMYNNELGTHKGAKNWTEYGLMPVDGEDKNGSPLLMGKKTIVPFQKLFYVQRRLKDINCTIKAYNASYLLRVKVKLEAVIRPIIKNIDQLKRIKPMYSLLRTGTEV